MMMFVIILISLIEKVFFKKVLDLNKVYVGMFDYFIIEEGDGNV